MTGKSIRIFLPDGVPTGLLLAEIPNWTGKVLQRHPLPCAAVLIPPSGGLLMPLPRARSPWMLAPAAALFMAGLTAAPSPYAQTPPAVTEIPAQAAPVGEAISGHVVVISIDGLRPDAIEKFGAGTLQRLMREGSYSLDAQTIMPSSTLPSHTSMLTGEELDEHGITWNRNEEGEHGHVEIPTVFAQAQARGMETAAFFAKGKFHHLNVPNTLDHVRLPDGNDKWSAAQTVGHVEAYLERTHPNLMFVHIGEPDYAGHKYSWMSGPYARAVRKADAAVAQVLEAADGAFGEGNYSVIVTADHGGSGWNHGSSDPRDTTIPWIAWGKGVRAGTVLPDGIRTMDTAATALWLLGVAEATEGEPVRLAFAPGGAAGSLALEAGRGTVPPRPMR